MPGAARRRTTIRPTGGCGSTDPGPPHRQPSDGSVTSWPTSTPRRALFGGLLAGETVDQGSVDGIRWVDLRWAGPLGLRLVGAEDPDAAGPVTEWLDGRPGRVHHLALAVEEPGGVPGARPADPGIATLGTASGNERTFEIPGDANSGLGIVLAGPDGAADPPVGGPVA